MGWTCKNCAFDANPDDNPQCQGCLSFRLPRSVVLIGQVSGQQLRMNITTTCGRRMLRAIAGDDAQYASEPQFEILRSEAEEAWQIRTCGSAANPTFYNGAALSAGPERLANGGVVSIGPERMKLTIQFEY